MEKRMTWEEMQKAFPDEWILVVDYEFTRGGQIKDGVLVMHSKNKEDIFSYPIHAEKVGLWYTGESQFMGLRSHAEHDRI